MIHALSALAIVGALLVLIVAIFFTGSRVKGPLASYLSSKSGLEVSIAAAEFSPLYPNIIKLSEVSFGHSLIGEFYLEFELGSLWSDELHINDIYINKLKLDPNDLQKIATSQFGYQKIVADAVRFHHTPLHTQYLQSLDATIRLHQVEFSHDQGLDFDSGVVSTEQASFFDRDIKGLTVEFERLPNGLDLKHFNLSMLGGIVSGYGQYLQDCSDHSLNYDTTSASDQALANKPQVSTNLVLPELNLSKIIIQESLPTAPNVNLQADTVNLTDVIFSSSSQLAASDKSTKQTDSNNNENTKPTAQSYSADTTVDTGYIMQGISGTITDLKLNEQGFSASFAGSIDSFSLPQVQTTFEHNEGKATLSTERVDFDFKGQLFEGNYALQGSLLRPEKELVLNQVELQKSKLALNKARLNYLRHGLGQYTVKLEDAKFSGLEFLSFINSLPLSIQSMSGSMSNLQLQPQHAALQPQADPELDGERFAQWHELSSHILPLSQHSSGKIQWQLTNTLYSNLLMQNIKGELEVGAENVQLKLPQVHFKESTLSAEATLERDLQKQSLLFVQAKDFESADLNSNLIDHMLTGKISLDAVLTSQRKHHDATNSDQAEASASTSTGADSKRLLNGSIVLQSPNMLVSDFGLDLINGGKQQNFTLSGTELLTAIQGSVAGINDLILRTTIKDNVAQTDGQLGLATANMRLAGELDLNSEAISGQADLISLARDSSTKVELSGSVDNMSFAINALRRGAERPGLYLPQYEASAVAKEQTDAAAVLKGLIQVEAPQDTSQEQQEPEELSLIDQALQQQEQAQEQAQNANTADTADTVNTANTDTNSTRGDAEASTANSSDETSAVTAPAPASSSESQGSADSTTTADNTEDTGDAVSTGDTSDTDSYADADSAETSEQTTGEESTTETDAAATTATTASESESTTSESAATTDGEPSEPATNDSLEPSEATTAETDYDSESTSTSLPDSSTSAQEEASVPSAENEATDTIAESTPSENESTTATEDSTGASTDLDNSTTDATAQTTETDSATTQTEEPASAEPVATDSTTDTPSSSEPESEDATVSSADEDVASETQEPAAAQSETPDQGTQSTETTSDIESDAVDADTANTDATTRDTADTADTADTTNTTTVTEPAEQTATASTEPDAPAAQTEPVGSGPAPETAATTTTESAPAESTPATEQHTADQKAAADEAQKMEDEASQFEINLLKDAFIDSLHNRENFDFTENDDELIF
ncbi:MAG TPA: hypothetical protein H9850_06965 [Candidatus Anaerobiospirillum pullistercoris]|uniref:Uncharacterized protein n=1 Tax=Candidatus Anaerobiospirillum pullistercoris TaxID=2838452 RepID=A0A9D1WDH4_9GAMM|nr:hypothetical protein [Candidatus Anaerobiospirillum pullistercoris]